MSLEKLNFKQLDMFHFDKKHVNFNDIARQNGFTYWYARDYMYMLGYESYISFKKAINKAITTCMTLDIDVTDNFEQCRREINGKNEQDYKLSRFACYLVAMNADNRKIEVANAQAFFAATAEAIRRYVDDAEDVERVLIREEVSEHEKSLSGIAKKAGVYKYALFQNAGYRGMYNMNLSKLKEYKRMKNTNRTLLDFMGKEELAANLFRITQTELKMKKDSIKGQNNAESTAEMVGRKVRKTMMEISGIEPEEMELSEDIKKIRTSLKQTHTGLKKVDKK
ncbi:MAG: damage-inducible protein D [Candidatus Electrothrix sp. AW1]|nr:damage-inducible protein D [Candidatus Electrothrix sp. AX1]MCI5181176.1 damage-inducible protein D [Candidatus Electrothrix gigas]